VLGEAGGRAPQRARAGQAGGDVRVDGAERRAVDEVERQPDRLRGGAAYAREPPEQLHVVVVDAEHPLVERLLRRPHRRRGGAGERAAQRARAVEGHRATVTTATRSGTRREE
jgi:hypothetical protein